MGRWSSASSHYCDSFNRLGRMSLLLQEAELTRPKLGHPLVVVGLRRSLISVANSLAPRPNGPVAFFSAWKPVSMTMKKCPVFSRLLRQLRRRVKDDWSTLTGRSIIF